MRKTIATVIATGTILLASGCGYTFEAEPMDGGMTGDSESGYEGDPRQVDCFYIEADGSSGEDSDDVQLGEFCRDGGTPPQQDEESGDDD